MARFADGAIVGTALVRAASATPASPPSTLTAELADAATQPRD